MRSALAHGLGGASRLVRAFHPEVESLRIARDVAYGAEHPAQRLDAYARPRGTRGELRPVVLYLHGGGFQILDKSTHWMFAVELTRAGCVVCLVDYRMAPRWPFPFAPRDAATAYRWIVEQASTLGADPQRIVVAGDSAGANLALGLCIASRRRQSFQWADALYDAVPPPAAALLFSGLLQVTDPTRVEPSGRLGHWALARLRGIERTYGAGATSHPLLDPLLEVERDADLGMPVFASVGRRDPIAADTLRLISAIREIGGPVEADIVRDEGHVFQAAYWRPSARHTWRKCRDFLATYCAPPSPVSTKR